MGVACFCLSYFPSLNILVTLQPCTHAPSLHSRSTMLSSSSFFRSSEFSFLLSSTLEMMMHLCLSSIMRSFVVVSSLAPFMIVVSSFVLCAALTTVGPRKFLTFSAHDCGITLFRLFL